jgi:hypothetical protein
VPKHLNAAFFFFRPRLLSRRKTMRNAPTEQQTEAMHRLAASDDGKSFFRMLAAELDAALVDFVTTTEDARFRSIQGEARAYREILAAVDAAVTAVRGQPPAIPFLAGGRPNQPGNPERLPDNGGF